MMYSGMTRYLDQILGGTLNAGNIPFNRLYGSGFQQTNKVVRNLSAAWLDAITSTNFSYVNHAVCWCLGVIQATCSSATAQLEVSIEDNGGAITLAPWLDRNTIMGFGRPFAGGVTNAYAIGIMRGDGTGIANIKIRARVTVGTGTVAIDDGWFIGYVMHPST